MALLFLASNKAPLGVREQKSFVSMEPHGSIRWYNPKLEAFEWREVPPTDEQALEVLDGSPHCPTCIRIYREWRELGASIGAALMRAGEAAKE
jgi:hypothetical protein